MTYSQEDLMTDIRQLRGRNDYKMKAGKPGIGLHQLYKEVSQRVSADQMVDLLAALRGQGTIIILAKDGFHDGRGSLVAVEQPLDITLFDRRDGRWKQQKETGEECIHDLRVYIPSDGLPPTLAKQGIVKRALERAAR